MSAAHPPVAIVPAAGSSRRMGAPKLLLPFAGTSVLGATVAALRAGGCERVVLVTAPASQGYEHAALAEWARQHALLHAINPTPERGMLSTLSAGLDALGGAQALAAAGGILLVAPGDLPALAPSTVANVRCALADERVAIAVPRHAGRHGHPMAIAARCVAEIPALDPSVGLRQLRDRHAAELLWVDVDDAGCVTDVDTPAQYAALVRTTENGSA